MLIEKTTEKMIEARHQVIGISRKFPVPALEYLENRTRIRERRRTHLLSEI